MKRILLVDDHPIIVKGLKSVLSETFAQSEFGVGRSPEEALEELKKAHWDIVIVDLNLPQRGGFELIRTMKELKPKVPVLIYSMYAEEQFGLRAIQAGADGYLPKDTDVEEIPKAVDCLFHGKRYIRENLAGVLVSAARGGNSQMAALSDREEQVLRMMASGKTATQIAEMLALSAKSVGTYRSRILDKLGLETTAELIRYAMDNGYV